MDGTIKQRGERNCPVCQVRMTLARHRKTEVDVCEQHGVWLDKGELEAITHRLEKRAGAQRRLAKRLGRREGLDDWVFGPLGFLFD